MWRMNVPMQMNIRLMRSNVTSTAAKRSAILFGSVAVQNLFQHRSRTESESQMERTGSSCVLIVFDFLLIFFILLCFHKVLKNNLC